MSIELHGKGFDCGKLKELLPDYLDRSLKELICREFEAHLGECEDCRIFVKTVEMTLVLYKYCPEREVPEEVSFDLRELLRLRRSNTGDWK